MKTNNLGLIILALALFLGLARISTALLRAKAVEKSWTPNQYIDWNNAVEDLQ